MEKVLISFVKLWALLESVKYWINLVLYEENTFRGYGAKHPIEYSSSNFKTLNFIIFFGSIQYVVNLFAIIKVKFIWDYVKNYTYYGPNCLRSSKFLYHF